MRLSTMVWTLLCGLLSAMLVLAQTPSHTPAISITADSEIHIDERKAVWISGGFYDGSFDDSTPLQMNVWFPTPPQTDLAEPYYLPNSS